jgi:hypothetical protein
MSHHISSGKLLLQNVSDNNWYYLDVRINAEGLPTLHPEQVIAFNNGEVDYDTYVLIRANNGIVYQLGLKNNSDGEVDYSWIEASLPFTQRPINLFLKNSTTGLFYQISGVENDIDGIVYVNVSLAIPGGNNSRTLTEPCSCPTDVSVMDAAVVLTEAGVLEECSILIPAAPTLPTYVAGSGRRERILGSGNGEKILSSH